MKTCLFTGFTSFLDYSTNPTEELANQLQSKTLGDYQIYSKILPVDYQRAEEMLGSLENYQLIVLNGLATGRSSISLETMAYNQIDSSRPDTQGIILQNHTICPNANAFLNSSFAPSQLSLLCENLNRLGHPVQLSSNPGRYLCNFIYYKTLFNLEQKNLPTPCLFIHWPEDQRLDSTSLYTVSKYLDVMSDFFTLLMLSA
ncbi:MAG: hypothetical protein HYV97_06565 [Bdellovibrio sp.]|nr:hypothetical protein [Bdellovibrio sp.]